MAQGPLIILSGPAGAGKTTVISRVVKESRCPLRVAISATTRKPRPGEQHGQDYYFLHEAEFQERFERGDFLESAEVHGHRYGTLRSEVDPHRSQGVGVVLVIDVQGADQVRAKVSDIVSIFVSPPSLEVLEYRLRDRGLDSEQAIARRLENARRELARAHEYAFQIVNDDMDTTVDLLRKLIELQFGRNQNA